MKAEIDAHGTLVITPDTQTEAYAMAHWLQLSTVQVNDLPRMETRYVRGTAILVRGPADKETS